MGHSWLLDQDLLRQLRHITRNILAQLDSRCTILVDLEHSQRNVWSERIIMLH